MIRTLLLALAFLCTFIVQAQYIPLSESAEISILTIGPGDNLYDKFGHSAFRVQDPERGVDAIYNYGVYDFDTPNFYTKFAQGKLKYKLEGVYAESFIEHYIRQERWVKQQELNLTYSEKQGIFNFLNTNLKPENKYYIYDFFYDNCATKIRDVLVSVLGEELKYTADFSSEGKTFRQLIQQNVHWNTWGSLGMDVAIGAVTDKKASSWEYQFLPDYVFAAAASATIERNGENVPLVKSTETLYAGEARSPSITFFTSPLFVFLLLSLCILALTYRDAKRSARSGALDRIIFGGTGIIGILLCLLWFATDHSATENNYNLLWAFPFNLLVAFFVGADTPKTWVRRYIIFLLLLLVLLTMHWLTGVQEFPYALLPLLVALLIRYVFLIRILKR